MDNKTYDEFWRAAKPLMEGKLASIRALLSAKLPVERNLTVAATYEAGDAERQLNVDVFTPKGTCVMAFEFVLTESEDAAPSYDGSHVENHCPECAEPESECTCGEGEGGVGVLLRLVGFNALALGHFAPKAYTSEAFTTDLEEVLNRVRQLDVEQSVDYAIEQLQTNQTLAREVAEADSQLD